MKSFKKILLVILIIPCVFLLNACAFDKPLYVTDIVQTETVGTKTTYTVYYSNGTSSIFSMGRGEDGEDGSDLTLDSIKAYCTANSIDFDSFLKEYLTVEVSTPTIQDAANKAMLSSVTIWAEHTTESLSYHIKDLDLFCGAGVIYQMEEEYSYVVTNFHVVYYSGANTTDKIARKITLFQYGTSEMVYTTDKKYEDGYPTSVYGYGAVDAEYVGGAMNCDLAVLRVKTADLKKFNEYATAATIADGYELGQTAIAIGNPACEGFSVTSGIISVVSERISMTGADDSTNCIFRVMRMDTSINGGNSGGGLYDINGHLIGIVNAKAVSTDIDNIAYALPLENVKAVADNLIYYHKQTNGVANAKKLVLGITVEAQNMHAIYNPITNRSTLVEDVVITQMEIGVGSNIGLHLGDKILSIAINDTTHIINKQYQIGDLLFTVRPGDKIIFTVERNGVERDFGITTSEGMLESQLKTIY